MTTPDGLTLVDKPLGATPLEALGLLRQKLPEFAGRKLAYAGRLDPMATGLLLVIGEPLLARQEEFWNLDKEYEAQVILGIRTDSHDLLGLADAIPAPEVPTERIMAVTAGLVGKTVLPVPVFSSTNVDGRPLFAWAREGSDRPLVVPARRMAIHEVRVSEIGVVSTEELSRATEERIPLVSGDFRQPEVISRWRRVLAPLSEARWPMLTLAISCAGGTYIRSVAHELGRRLGTGAVLAGLRRVKVGPWSVDGPAVVRFS